MGSELNFCAALVVILLCFSSAKPDHSKLHIGVIIDAKNRVGKEEKIAMEMAADDFNNSLTLQLRDLSGHSAKAILLASDLIENKVEVIVGSLSWQDAAVIGEMKVKYREIPIISLLRAPANRFSNPEVVNPVVHMVPDASSQFKCIAQIAYFLNCRKVSVIYEDRNIYAPDLTIITLLSDALRDVDAEIGHYSVVPAFSSLQNASFTIREALKKMMDRQSMVYIVAQSSLSFAALLFEQAKQLGMMEEGNIWIVADEIASLLDSLNSRRINSMEGVVGCKPYFSESSESFRAFKGRFIRRFLSEYPETIEENPDPSVFALRAYDSIWITAKAIKRLQSPGVLLSDILLSNSNGLTRNVWFGNHSTMEVPIFCIVNVIGKRYREVGFWSTKHGFMKNPLKNDSCSSADEVLGSVYWPGFKHSKISRSMLESNSSTVEQKIMRILVPARSNYTQLVRVIEGSENIFSGFAIDVFTVAVNSLPYPLPYTFIPFVGSYDAMIQMIFRKEVDGAVGDIQTHAEWSRLVAFTQPYIDSSLVMVVQLQFNHSGEVWMLMKVFSNVMWILLGSMSFFTGFVIWVIEHRSNEDFRGPPLQQIGKVLWFSFTTLYLGQRESLTRNLSRFVMVPWLFLILIVSASFMANLTSMMTASRLVASTVDVEVLRKSNAAVGYDGSELITRFLISVLRFRYSNIKSYATVDDIARALTAGQIQAAFILSPHAKIFLAKYCKGFTTSGPTYNLGGFSFVLISISIFLSWFFQDSFRKAQILLCLFWAFLKVFQRDSSVALDVSDSIQKLKENGTMGGLEDEMISLIKCSTRIEHEDQSLGPKPFSGMFILSGVVSASALLISIAGLFRDLCQKMKDLMRTYIAVYLRQ